MAVIQGVNEITFEAAGDMTLGKHRAGVINASRQVAIAGAGDIPDVIIMDSPVNTDDHVNCHHISSSVRVAVALGGTVTAGHGITPDATGDFIETTSAEVFVLTAEVAGADGEIITALCHNTKTAP